MYRGRFWTMRQYAGFATAEESNQRYRYLLDQGQTGLSVAFDLPTQIGYDADDPMSMGEVGKVGVSISSTRDMEQLFDQILVSYRGTEKAELISYYSADCYYQQGDYILSGYYFKNFANNRMFVLKLFECFFRS